MVPRAFPLVLIFVLNFATPPAGFAQDHSAPGRTTDRASRTQVFLNDAPLWIEIASTPAARRVGLKFRRHLPEDEGMLFVFEEPAYHAFWMSQTPLPLDIAFLDEYGVITDIAQMTPLDEHRIYRPTEPIRYAIEVNRGWFAKHRIRVGDRLSGLTPPSAP